MSWVIFFAVSVAAVPLTPAVAPAAVVTPAAVVVAPVVAFSVQAPQRLWDRSQTLSQQVARLFFSLKLTQVGYLRPVNQEDLWNISGSYRVEEMTDRFESHLDRIVEKHVTKLKARQKRLDLSLIHI